jgi:hypothetical protein
MNAIQDCIDHLKLGEAVTFKNLTMFPLIGGDAGERDYLTLDEALAAKVVRITEVDASGSVPELKFTNDSDRQVLLMDGEELVGAKQNRTLNISILAPAHVELKLPVTCVEAGRWAHASAEFASAERSHYAAGRAQKQASVSDSLRHHGSRAADQGEVWQDIASKSMRLASHSETQAMAAMYEQHDTSVENFVEALKPAEGQRGAVFAIGDEIIGCDLFDRSHTLAKQLAKIVRSYALDAVDSESSNGAQKSPCHESAAAYLKSVANSDCDLFPAVGLGEDVRLRSETIAGGALKVDTDLIHLCAFTTKPRAAEHTPQATLNRASMRSRSYSQQVE